MAAPRIMLQRVSSMAAQQQQSLFFAARRGSKNFGWYQKALRNQEKMNNVTPVKNFPEETLHGKERMKAFMDIRMGEGATPKRITLRLADDIVPRTVENFVNLCKAPPGEGYKDSKIFRVRKGFGIEGGDHIRGDGRGGFSSFGSKFFEDENFVGRHAEPGTISMTNSGVHRNSSTFFISVAPQPQMDGRNVVFGEVVDGLDVVEEISGVFNVMGKPADSIVIEDCGVLDSAEH
eukprot:gb/GECG01015434.1/.p1 GENE.gb/GECG01015434.1/~~gb/GECG01015434.1/.p1  ORF type:complete len:234 (+),score=30.98 gb/GECG01015434.1/:1-702(+)